MRDRLKRAIALDVIDEKYGDDAVSFLDGGG